MTVSLKLTQSINEIQKEINKAIYLEIKNISNKNINKVKNVLYKNIAKWIEEQPEIISLKHVAVTNSLGALFGLTPTEATSAVSSIITSIINSVKIDINLNDKLDGNIIFNFQPDDLSNLLNLPEGHRNTLKNTDLHWLDWLLTKGNTVIIVGYYYAPSTKGRSAAGNMVQGGSFRVPPEFAGNKDNNFITRAFSNRQKEIENILRGLLQ